MEFIQAVLSKESFTLRVKCDIVGYILKNNFSAEVKKSCPNFYGELEKLVDFRNHLAHRSFISGSKLNSTDKKTMFIENFKTRKSKLVKEIIPLNPQELADIDEMFRNVVIVLSGLHELLELYRKDFKSALIKGNTPNHHWRHR